MPLYKEKELEFTFSNQLKWEELDKQGVPLPEKMCLVDLVIERTDDVLLVEIKDPSHSGMNQDQRNAYLQKMKNKELIHQGLVPKVRDSYSFMHLMERDDKPFIYVVLLGLCKYTALQQAGLLGTFKDRLLGRIKQEAVTPWARNYVKDCVVLTLAQWNTNKYFSQFPVTRVP